MLEKTDREGIYRDINTGALVNKDNDGLTAYKKKKQFFSEAHDTHKKIQKVENEINEIKNLLKQLLEK